MPEFLSSIYQGSGFEPLTEEEVKRRKQAEDEKNRVKMEKLHKKQEKKQKQAGRDYFFFNLKQEVWMVLYSDSVTLIEYSQTFLIWTSIMLPFPGPSFFMLLV